MSENVKSSHPGGDVAQSVVDVARDVGTRGASGPMDLLLGVSLDLTVELGRSRMRIHDILALATGSVVELDKLASEPVSLYVNGTLMAHAEVVVVEDHFAVRILSLVEGAVPGSGGA